MEDDVKLLIISDIHANSDALRTVLAAESNADVIYCAGDFVDCGPDPSEVLTLCREVGMRAVMGNHDAIVLREAGGVLTAPYTAASYSRSCLGCEDLLYLESLPESIFWVADGVEYYMTHRYGTSYSDRICTPEKFDSFWRENCPDTARGSRRRLIFGHTHQQYMVSPLDGWDVINPGSLSYQRRGEHGIAEYAVVEDGEVNLVRLTYPTGAIEERARRLKLVPDEQWIWDMFSG